MFAACIGMSFYFVILFFCYLIIIYVYLFKDMHKYDITMAAPFVFWSAAAEQPQLFVCFRS